MAFIDPNYTLEEEVSWLFNINHFYLAIGVLAFIMFGLYIAPIKNKTLIKINKVFLGLLLIGLESGRIAYYCVEYKLEHLTLEGLDIVSTISFQMCATMTWSFAFILILSAFIPDTNKFLQYNYNFFFGGAFIGAASCFVNPLIVDPKKPIWHFRNIQTVLVHSLLVLIPLLLIKWKCFKVQFKNVWMNLVGFVCIGTISMSVSIATGHDFAFSKTIPLEGIPTILFPFQQLVIMLLMIAGDVVLYLSFELVRYLKIRHKNGDLEVLREDFNFYHYSYYVSSITTCLIAIGVDMLLAYLIGPEVSNKGFLCLIPLIYCISLLILIEYKYKNISVNLFKSPYKTLDLFLMLNPVINVCFISEKHKKKMA